MTNTTILIIVLAIVVLIAILVLVGLNRKKAKTISFDKTEADQAQPKELTQQEKSGNYQAQGGFNFATAKKDEKQAQVLPGQELAGEQAPVVPQLEHEALLVEEELAQVPEVDVTTQPESVATEGVDKQAEEENSEASAKETSSTEEPEKPADSEEPGEENFAALDEFHEIEETEESDEPTGETTSEDDAVSPSAEDTEAEAAAAAATQAIDAAEEALAQAPKAEATAVETPAVEAKPTEDIDPAAGRIGRLRGRLARSQNVFGKSVLGMLSAGDLDEDAWEDIEAQLIQADLGVKITMNVVEELRDMIATRGVSSEAEARAMLRECLITACKPEMDRSIKAIPYEGKPAVVLMVGVNGTGKTTTTGKLARVLVSMGHKVLLGAADTFRAAAADQLEAWGRRVGATTVRGAEGADPASVAFDAVSKGIETSADVVVIDTAGRLHNSANLMDQLGKVKRVVEKRAEVDEVLLVIDATTGQNGLNQARVFGEVVQITGVVLTKLDGTAKGGIVFQVQEDLGVPVKLVGLGEGADDLAPFEVEGFVDALLG